MILYLLILNFCITSIDLCLAQAAQKYSIKFATVAPEGSTWMKHMKQLDKAIKALNLSQEEVEEMGRAADPDPNWKNGQWILKQWTKGNVNLTDPDVIAMVRLTIEKLEQAKKEKSGRGR